MEEIVRNRRSDDPLTAVHDARRRVIATRTARLLLRREPDSTSDHPEPGRLARLRRTLAGTGKPVEGEGILDLSRPGAAYDHGEFAVTEIGDDIRGGAPGRLLAGLPVDPNCRPGPLWFLGAVEFLDEAADDGTGSVADVECRRLRVIADLTAGPDVRAAETAAAMRWVPAGIADPANVPFTVWVDDDHLRRVAVTIGDQVLTLELGDFGVDVSDFDWTRLSTFRTSVQEDARSHPNSV